jgi:hypothetical protein
VFTGKTECQVKALHSFLAKGELGWAVGHKFNPSDQKNCTWSPNEKPLLVLCEDLIFLTDLI